MTHDPQNRTASIEARTVRPPLDNTTTFSNRMVHDCCYTLVLLTSDDGVTGIGFCDGGSLGGSLPDHRRARPDRPGAWSDRTPTALRASGPGATSDAAARPIRLGDTRPQHRRRPLWVEPRALVTPHSENLGNSQIVRLSARVTEDIRRFVAGKEMLSAVYLEAGY